MTVLVTGASGFVGSALCARMRLDGHSVLGTVRRLDSNRNGSQAAAIGNLAPDTNWTALLKNVDGVVHLAACVHMMADKSADPLTEFRRVNGHGTTALARQAAAAGVKRFVFLSSIKVNGEFTKLGKPFTADDFPAPIDPYGISKHEAEQSLRQIAAETGMEVVIIRSPLVYGPGVKANFRAMMNWLARGLPLPLAAVTENRRSLVALDNLVDLIATCLDHPSAANQTFLVSDGEDLSTAALLKRTAQALGHPARLFPIPPLLLRLAASIFNKQEAYQRLCGSLQIDITRTKRLLGWAPPISVDEGLSRAAAGFIR